MLNSGFIQLIKGIINLPSEQEEKFKALISVQTLQKGEHFVRAGRSSRTIAYVNEGLFRYYYTAEDGIEFTKGFFERHTVLSAYDAILENTTAHYSIEALEDASIETVDYDKFKRLFPEHPGWNEFLVAMLQKGYLAKVRREREFLLMNAEQRYQSFKQRYPGLQQRVKQQIIASYIGITPESLSRLRKSRAS